VSDAAPLESRDAAAPGLDAEAPDRGALPPLEPEAPVPPLRDRVWEVLARPRAAFARHDGRWGVLGPWAVVAAVSLVLAVGVFARVDLDARIKAGWERVSSSERAGMRGLTDDQRDQAARVVAFFEKAKWVLAPLGALASLVLWGLVAFGACHLLSPRRPDLLRCLSVSAYSGLAGAVGDAAQLAAVLLGRAPDGTGPATLVDPLGSPHLHSALARLDPALLFGYGLFAIGLTASCGLERRRAYGLCGAVWLVLSAAAVGLAAAGAA